MTEEMELRPYTLDTELTGYMPIPREITAMQLPSTAVLIYGALLDRGTLSRKNHYTDETGRVYVIYLVERLAHLFHLSDTAVKRHLRELESCGLLRWGKSPAGESQREVQTLSAADGVGCSEHGWAFG